MELTTLPVIRPVHDVDFLAEASAGERQLAVRLSGNADLNVKTQLDEFLRSVHDQAQRFGVEQVHVDVRALEFMNSSCLKSFVWWITAVQRDEAHQYRIVFQSSASMYWQRRSLNALACLASDLIYIQN